MRRIDVRRAGARRAAFAARRVLREIMDPKRRRRRKLRAIQVRGPLIEQGTLRDETRILAGW